ncbi:hypothetical protein M2359_004048 [Gordonia amarae]|nr:hypothetical protein [Gordonia amarae]MCS3880419.1 hypothetical protein [Gordonia amarae]
MRIQPQRAGFDVVAELTKLLASLGSGSTASPFEAGSSGTGTAQ